MRLILNRVTSWYPPPPTHTHTHTYTRRWVARKQLGQGGGILSWRIFARGTVWRQRSIWHPPPPSHPVWRAGTPPHTHTHGDELTAMRWVRAMGRSGGRLKNSSKFQYPPILPHILFGLMSPSAFWSMRICKKDGFLTYIFFSFDNLIPLSPLFLKLFVIFAIILDSAL